MLKSLVNRRAAREEFEIMRQLDHPNIVKVLESVEFSFQQCSYFGIAMEFMPLGDLRTFINMKNAQSLDDRNWNEKDALIFVAQVVSGLSYLHQKEILHRDLKPSNILLGENNRLVIGDFGISDKLMTTRITRIVGTDDFLPPEAIENREEAENLTFSRDMWSCGIVIFMISYLKHPLTEQNRIKTMVNICQGLNLKQKFIKRTTNSQNATIFQNYVSKRTLKIVFQMHVCLQKMNISQLFFINSTLA